MEPPEKRKTEEDFDAAVSAHLAAKCMLVDEVWYCKECKDKIDAATCYVSVHTVLFDTCAGGGEVRQKLLPYCPTCEGAPEKNATCVHE
jgi:hypothetical protein